MMHQVHLPEPFGYLPGVVSRDSCPFYNKQTGCTVCL